MIKVLFVCHGNICRSPMAEFIFKDMAEKEGLDAAFSVSSAAVSGEESGSDMSRDARETLAAHGVPFTRRHAHRVTEQELAESDLVLVMDEGNRRYLNRMFSDRYDEKIRLLLSYTGWPRDIADPWYTDNYEIAYVDIERGCRALLEHLTDTAPRV